MLSVKAARKQENGILQLQNLNIFKAIKVLLTGKRGETFKNSDNYLC